MPDFTAAYAVSPLSEPCLLARAHRRRAQIQVSVEAGVSASPEDRESAFASARLDVEQGNGLWAAFQPATSALLRRIRTPMHARNKAEEVLPSLLDVQLPFPLDECVYRVVSWTRDPSGTWSALVAAVRHQDLERSLEACSAEVSMQPHLLIHEALVYESARECGLPLREQGGHLILVHQPSYLLGVWFLNGQIQGAVHLRTSDDAPPVQRLMDRIHRQFGKPPSTWAWSWVGDGEIPPELPGAADALGESAEQVFCEDPASFPVRCLARFALEPRALALNFRVDEYMHPALRDRSSRREKRMQVLLLAASLLWIFLSLGWMQLYRQAESDRRHQITEQAMRLAPERRIQPGMEILTVERSLENSAEDRAAVSQLSEGGILPELRIVLEAAKAVDAKVSGLQFSSPQVEIQGRAQRLADVQNFEARIESSGFTVEPEIRQEEESVRFVFRGVGG